MKCDERDEARRLRAQEGLALREIAARLGVALSSVSRWTRDIELSERQLDALREQNPIFNRQRSGQAVAAARARAARERAQRHGRELAMRGDPLHIQGCMLYWAEGAKSRNTAALVNSDPELLDVFLRFLRLSYDVPLERIALTVNCHLGNGLSLEEIEAWWLRRLALPHTSLRRSRVNDPSVASLRKRNTLVHGTARVAVFSTFVVQSIFGGIQAYAGFDRPRWLD